MERTANPKANVGGYSFYYSVIKGFDDFTDGKSDTIEGLTAVDDHTLQIELTEPTGDLGYRFAMATSAPIPPLNDGEYGAATGHDKDYGRYLVAIRPVHVQGLRGDGLLAPIKDQDPAPGYIPGRSIELVRNPTWSADTDDLRKAYPDRDRPSRSAATTTTSTTRSKRVSSISSSTGSCRRIRSSSTRPTLRSRTA